MTGQMGANALPSDRANCDPRISLQTACSQPSRAFTLTLTFQLESYARLLCSVFQAKCAPKPASELAVKGDEV
jgi:hypothetical protein